MEEIMIMLHALFRVWSSLHAGDTSWMSEKQVQEGAAAIDKHWGSPRHTAEIFK